MQENNKVFTSDKFQHISESEHTYRNIEQTGFEVRNAIFQTIREITENSLDSCERGKIFPDITISLREMIEDKDYNKMPPDTYEIKVSDNGIGIPKENLAMAFGSTLTSTKYGQRQQRGRYGMGIKNAIIYAQKHLQRSIKVASSPISQFGGITDQIFLCDIKINITTNEPLILNESARKNDIKWHGLVISIVTTGDVKLGEILEYLKRTATICPYAKINFNYTSTKQEKSIAVTFEKNSDIMPEYPQESKPHPHGIDAEYLRRLKNNTSTKTLEKFMIKHFQRIGDNTAIKFLTESGFDPNKSPATLNEKDLVELASCMKKYTDFLPPDASCLSLITEEVLKAGIMKEYKPEFFTYKDKKGVYEGHAFAVECAIIYGGYMRDRPDFRKNLYRFCNKIPLIHDWKDCMLRGAVDTIDFSHYDVTDDMPLGIFIHLASTKPPYAGVGKESLRKVEEIEETIDLALKECGRKLKEFLSHREHAELAVKRKGIYETYAPMISESLAFILGEDQSSIDKMIVDLIEHKEVSA